MYNFPYTKLFSTFLCSVYKEIHIKGQKVEKMAKKLRQKEMICTVSNRMW